MSNPSDEQETDRIDQIVAGYADKLNDANMALVIESAGVAQAVDALRQALDKVEQCLNNRQYEEVANLGFRDVSSEYIFLQRTMGGLLSKAHERSAIVSDIAMDAKVPYEQVSPLVEKWEQSKHR